MGDVLPHAKPDMNKRPMQLARFWQEQFFELCSNMKKEN
jgi:hypothetical protein